MEHIEILVSKILGKYSCFSLPSESEKNKALILEEYLYLPCIANTYSTDDYVVVINDNENLYKSDFLTKEDIPHACKYGIDKSGPKEKFETCDISDVKFVLDGVACCVAIFEIATLDIKQVYYFPSCYCDVDIKLDHYNDMVIVQGKKMAEEESYTYILKLGAFQKEFYATINGESKRFNQILVVIPFGHYDVASSLSIIDLKTMTEYILADEFDKRGIKPMIDRETSYNEENGILSIYYYDVNENREEVLNLSMDYIQKHCVIKDMNSQDIDSIQP